MTLSLSGPVARDRAAAPADTRALKKALNRMGLYGPVCAMTSPPPDEPGLDAVYPEAILIPVLRAGSVLSTATRAASGVIGRVIRSGQEINRDNIGRAQRDNLRRFENKIPANSRNSVVITAEKNGTITITATSPGKSPVSRAVYKKTVDRNGKTISYRKITYDKNGRVIHSKDKMIKMEIQQ